MIAALPLLFLAAATNVPVTDAPPQPEPLVRKFIDACMLGQARFGEREVSEVARKQLPSVLQRWYADTADGRFYVVNVGKPGFLVTFTNPAKGRLYPHGCAIASREIDIRAAWEALSSLPTARIADRRIRDAALHMAGFRMPDIDDGYIVTGSDIGDHMTVLQVSFLSDQEKARMQKLRDDYRAKHPEKKPEEAAR